MKLFGKNRDSLRIKKARACRALFMLGDGTEEVEIQLLTEDGEKLSLQVPAKVAGDLVGQLTDAYEAINPPLNRRSNQIAGWDGAS